MDTFVSVYNFVLGIGSIVMIVIGILAFVVLATNAAPKIEQWINRNIFLFGFLITLAAMVTSLIYSDFIGYPPCLLCWYMRVFIYPQVFMFLYALIKKDSHVLPYALILTFLGFLVGAYDFFLVDLAHVELITCTVSGVSCTIRYVYEFGFVTIPFMGLAAFFFLGSLITIALKRHRMLEK